MGSVLDSSVKLSSSGLSGTAIGLALNSSVLGYVLDCSTLRSSPSDLGSSMLSLAPDCSTIGSVLHSSVLNSSVLDRSMLDSSTIGSALDSSVPGFALGCSTVGFRGSMLSSAPDGYSMMLGSVCDCSTIRLALNSSALSCPLESTVGSSLSGLGGSMIGAAAPDGSTMGLALGSALDCLKISSLLSGMGGSAWLGERLLDEWIRRLSSRQLGARGLNDWIFAQQLDARLRGRRLRAWLVAQ